jgi:hypothetical protein
MRRRQLLATVPAVVLAAGGALAQQPPKEPTPTPTLLAEVRRSFTLDGERIPPEIFRDFGDGNLADSTPIWVTIDLRAAVGSNFYADDITQNGDWVSQRKAAPDVMNGRQEAAYKYIGATENGLLLVLATYNSGGSGNFTTLHLLSLEAVPAFDSEGAAYERINLTNLRSLILGDRWDGQISFAKNMVRVVTTREGPADRSGTRREMSFEARRP